MTAAPFALQHPTELARLVELYRRWRPKSVLEVGTYLGGTLYEWVVGARAGARIVSVDREDVSRRVAEWSDLVRVDLRVVRGDSHDPDVVGQVAELGPYEWVFLDADHREEAVRADWSTYSTMTTPGAVVALHDVAPSSDRTIEVDRLWAELVAEYRTVEYVEPGGFGIGVVFMPGEKRPVFREQEAA